MSQDLRPQDASFESVWTDLGPRLKNALVADGVERYLAEDIVQETGTRLFVRWSHLDTTTSVMPLALTIARNQVVDHHRKYGKVEPQEMPLQEVLGFDVEEQAMARMHLAAVYRALRKLNPRYRTLLLAEAGYVGMSPGGPATRTARSRARHGLKLLMESASDAAWVAVGPIGTAIRRFSVKLKQLGGRPEWATLGQAAAGAFLFFAALPSLSVSAHTHPPAHSAPDIVAIAVADELSPVTSHSRANGEPSLEARDVAQRARGSEPSRADRSLLPPLPGSKGHNTGGGGFGLDGFDENGQGSGDFLGERVHWSYRAEYRNPECVRHVINGELDPGCDASPEAEGGASVRHRDREFAVDTSD